MATTPSEEKYHPNLSTRDGFYDAPEEIHGYDATPDSGVHDLSSMDPEQRARLEEEWKMELAKVEEEILTLRQVVSAKMREAQELKRKLGITAWKEFKDDMEQGIKNIQESTAYQRTSGSIRTAGEKTTAVLGTFGASVSKKLGDVKNSTVFKSFEDKVGTAYSSVKTKMSNSRSNSTNSFEESLNNHGGRSSSNVATPITSPTIPEEKPLA